MSTMDYQFFVLLAPTLGLVIYVIADYIKGVLMNHNAAGHLF